LRLCITDVSDSRVNDYYAKDKFGTWLQMFIKSLSIIRRNEQETQESWLWDQWSSSDGRTPAYQA
jgi:hypothetical protein